MHWYEDSAEAILERRYARGEIDQQENQERVAQIHRGLTSMVSRNSAAIAKFL